MWQQCAPAQNAQGLWSFCRETRGPNLIAAVGKAASGLLREIASGCWKRSGAVVQSKPLSHGAFEQPSNINLKLQKITTIVILCSGITR